MRPVNSPIGGINMPSTSEVTMRLKAAPIITPTASSITLPRAIKSLNSFTNPDSLINLGSSATCYAIPPFDCFDIRRAVSHRRMSEDESYAIEARSFVAGFEPFYQPARFNGAAVFSGLELSAQLCEKFAHFGAILLSYLIERRFFRVVGHSL